jgi:hypothetical protein
VKLVGSSCPDERKNLVLNNGTIIPVGELVNLNEVMKDEEKKN